VHSLHSYFIRRGDHEEPIRFEVDRIRNGRSFVTRSVIARQSVGAILNMSASFQVDEPAADKQIAVPPDVPSPGDLPGQEWMGMFERRFVRGGLGSGRAVGWLRMRDAVGDDPALHAVALAYMSDDLPTDAVVALLYPDRKPGEWDQAWPFWSASVDHAIWFHRPVRADQWQLQDFTCHGLMSSRGLSVGHVFDTGGVHLATISQEVLVRELRS
jgi:acyl-CoA thioesterase-2